MCSHVRVSQNSLEHLHNIFGKLQNVFRGLRVSLDLYKKSWHSHDKNVINYLKKSWQVYNNKKSERWSQESKVWELVASMTCLNSRFFWRPGKPSYQAGVPKEKA